MWPLRPLAPLGSAVREGISRQPVGWKHNAWDLWDLDVARELQIDSELCFIETKELVDSMMALWEVYKIVLLDSRIYWHIGSIKQQRR